MKARIKQIRKDNGMTQQSFAEALGVSHGSAQSWELGRQIPSSSAINLICVKFNINEEWLRTGIGDMHAPQSREDAMGELLSGMIKDEDQNRQKLLEAIVEELKKMKPEHTKLACETIINISKRLQDQ